MGIDVACMKGVSIMIVVTVTGPALGRALGGRAGLSVEKKSSNHACMHVRYGNARDQKA